MTRKRRIRLCRQGLYYLIVVLAVLVGATARQLNLLMLLGAMLAGPFLFSLIFGRMALGRLSVQRMLPPQLSVDQRLIVDVGISNPRRWLGMWSIEVEDAVARDASGGVAAPKSWISVFFSRIAPKETRFSTYYGQLPRRGRYVFGPMRVSTRFPLGLIRHSVVLPDPQTLLVHPKIGRLTREWGQVVRENATGAQRMRRGLLEADFYGLRDWRPGDNRRWIHWRTSARRGMLVVRQFEQRRSQDLALLVDLWQPSDATAAHEEHVEQAISFVATLLADACRHPGRKVAIDIEAQSPLHRAGPATSVFFSEQMDELAVISPHSQADFPDALIRSLAQVGSSIPTLLISTREIDWDAIEVIARRHRITLAGRRLRSINVASPELARFFADELSREAVCET
jgi:uncharacterized protein (DUF58 family)